MVLPYPYIWHKNTPDTKTLGITLPASLKIAKILYDLPRSSLWIYGWIPMCFMQAWRAEAMIICYIFFHSNYSFHLISTHSHRISVHWLNERLPVALVLNVPWVAKLSFGRRIDVHWHLLVPFKHLRPSYYLTHSTISHLVQPLLSSPSPAILLLRRKGGYKLITINIFMTKRDPLIVCHKEHGTGWNPSDFQSLAWLIVCIKAIHTDLVERPTFVVVVLHNTNS